MTRDLAAGDAEARFGDIPTTEECWMCGNYVRKVTNNSFAQKYFHAKLNPAELPMPDAAYTSLL